MPGVQVLFAFLLAVPFQQRFAAATAFQKDVYFVTLLAAAAASALFIAPTAYHRLTFGEGEKKRIIKTSTRFAIAGIGALAVAMNGAVLLVTDVIFDRDAAVITTVATGLVFGGLWFGLGIARRLKRESER